MSEYRLRKQGLSVSTTLRLLKRRIVRLIALTLIPAVFPYLVLGPKMLYALPQGWSVENGDVNFSLEDNTLSITTSDNAIINFESFNINPGEIVNFIQSGSSSSVLSRVSGGFSSDIFGSLFSNGQLVLVNANGITFHDTANVQVGSLIASTLDIQSAMYLQSSLSFEKLQGSSLGAILNEGTLRAGEGGYVALLAEQVRNTGTIQANLGSVVLSAGEKQTLSFDNGGLINLVVDRGLADVAEGQIPVENLGMLQANGGKIVLSAKTLNDVMDTLINNTGIVEAVGVEEREGKIEFISNGTTIHKGTADVSSAEGRGGEVKILGHQVGLFDSAVVNASGALWGGNVLIGGDFQGKNPLIFNASKTYISQQASIYADALVSGTGGKVIVWADDSTRFYGSIFASDGFVEVSGKSYLDFHGHVEAKTLLLDPANITLSTGADSNTTGFTAGSDQTEAFADDSGQNTVFDITAGTGSFAGVSAGTTIQLQATNDITVSNAFNVGTATGVANVSLVLRAQNDININAAITVDGTGSLTLTADDDTSGAGRINLAANLQSDGGAITLNGPIVVGASLVTIDTETGNNNNAGSITLNGAVSAAAVGYDLTLVTASTGAGMSGGALNMKAFSNNAGSGFYINDLTMTLTGGSGGSAGTMTLDGDIYLDSNGADLSNFNHAASGGQVVLNRSVTIDMEQGNDAASGGMTTQTGFWSAAGVGYDLVINTSSTTAAGGGVNFTAMMNNAAGFYLNDVTMTGAGSANSALIALHFNGTYYLDDDGAGDLASFTLIGNSSVPNFFYAPVLIDTQQGDNAAGGSVDFGSYYMSSNAAHDVTLDTSTTFAGASGGAVVMGPSAVNTTRFNDFLINTGAGNGGTAGQITIGWGASTGYQMDNIGADLGSFTITGGGNVVLNSTLTITIEGVQSTSAGNIDFGTSSISANAAGYDLSLNASASTGGATGGSIILSSLNNAGGFYINDLTLNTDGAATDGNITASGAWRLDDNGAGDLANITLTGAGNFILGGSLTIDTEQGNTQAAGAVSFGSFLLSASGAGNNLTIDTGSSANGASGAAITLTALGNGGGAYINNLSLSSVAGTGGTAGTVAFNGGTLAGDVSVTNMSQAIFTAGTSTIVTGSTTLQGSSGNLLLLRSSSATNEWSFNPQGTRNISFVDVQDSTNLNATPINPLSSVNSGRNNGWFVNASSPELTLVERIGNAVEEPYRLSSVSASQLSAVSLPAENLLPPLQLFSSGNLYISSPEALSAFRNDVSSFLVSDHVVDARVQLVRGLTYLYLAPEPGQGGSFSVTQS